MLDAVPDHVAIAVPDWDLAASRWADELGGRVVSWSINPLFRSRQYRFVNGAKLELLTLPEDEAGGDHFVRRFLDRFGSQVHHLTLKVADIHDAIASVRAAGFDVIDVRTDGELWREGFLRPSQVGGLVVQLGWSSLTDDEVAARRGHVPQTSYHSQVSSTRQANHFCLKGRRRRGGEDLWPDDPGTRSPEVWFVRKYRLGKRLRLFAAASAG